MRNIPDGNYWVKVLDEKCTENPQNRPYECHEYYTWPDGQKGSVKDPIKNECKVICKPGSVRS